MTIEIKNPSINILYISPRSSDMREVKEHILRSLQTTYNVEHRPDFFGASDLLSQEAKRPDVILLDLVILAHENSREAFRRMLDMAHGIPIIIFSTRNDHERALLAVEDGAADNITKGELDADIIKFDDVVSFSMARARASINIQKQNTNLIEKTEKGFGLELQKIRTDNIQNMDEQRKKYEEIVTSVIERGDKDISRAVADISELLTQAKVENNILIKQLKRHGLSHPRAND